MTSIKDPAPGSYRRWAIFAIGSLNFLLSMFYRVSTAVISPALVREMDITSAQLSNLSAAFYYAFALCQLPLGIAIDRVGARIAMSLLSVAAVGGAVWFAMGTTPGQLTAARALLGIGMSGNMMILMALLSQWFPVNRFAFLTGTAVALGALGNLLAATPLAMLNLKIGWRASFVVFGLVNAVVVAAFIFVARDGPEARKGQARPRESILAGLRHLARMYGYWAISLSNFVRYGFFAALQSLWLAPFMTFGLGLSEINSANALFCMGIGYMVGLPFWGSISDRILLSRKRAVLPTMAAFCLIMLSFVRWERSPDLWKVFLACFGLGFTAAPGQIMYAHIKELVPHGMAARAMTSVNLFTILGVGAAIHLLGSLVGPDPSKLTTPESFSSLWWAGAVALVAACIVYGFVPDSSALRREGGRKAS